MSTRLLPFLLLMACNQSALTLPAPGPALDGGVADPDLGRPAPDLGAPVPDAGTPPVLDAGTPDDLGGGQTPAPRARLLERRTGFLDYGRAIAVFDGPVDPAEVSVTIEPVGETEAPAIAVLSQESIDAHMLRLILDRPHVSREYVFTARIESAGGSVESSTLAFGTGARVAFVTRQSGPGDLGSWTEDPDDVGVFAGDAVCRREAEEAGLRGTFVAYLGHEGETDASCRALGVHGLEAEGCGRGILPDGGRAILDARGLPIVLRGHEDVFDAAWRAPVRYFADGAEAPESNGVWTGADRQGLASGSDCEGWTSASGDVRATGDAAGTRQTPYPSHSFPCSGPVGRPGRLLCFQLEYAAFHTTSAHEREGRTAFVTRDVFTGELGGTEGADALCQQRAEATGRAGEFVAWVSAEGDDAYCRLVGGHGTRDEGCGGVMEQPGPGWVSTDGYPLADDLAGLEAGLVAPLLADEDGAPLLGRPSVHTGTNPDGRRRVVGDMSFDCAGWTSASPRVQGSGGIASGVGRYWSAFYSGGCDREAHLYCLER